MVRKVKITALTILKSNFLLTVLPLWPNSLIFILVIQADLASLFQRMMTVAVCAEMNPARMMRVLYSVCTLQVEHVEHTQRSTGMKI